jgi:tetratricopeptide (TPR) repeat protein
VGEPRFNFPLVLARMAVFLDPTQEEARRLVGAILNVYGDYDGAATVLGAIPPASPFFEQARIDIAAGLSAGEKPKAAEKVLKEALRRDPKGRDLKWSLAAHYAEMKDHEKAVAAISKLIVELGEPPPAEAWRYHVSRGASLIELDRWPEAEKDLKRAVELAPDEPMALNYLGYSWAERGLNLEEAFNLLDKAVAARPDSGAIVDSLGWAHFQLGQYDQAVGHLERAAALEPSDPTVTEHLGDVYWRLGRDIEALYQWRMALELEATEAQRKAIEKKLVDGMPPPAQRKAAD